MSWVAWIIVGLVAGVAAKVIMPGNSEEPSGLMGTVLLGITGAVGGGWIWNLFLGQMSSTGVNPGSIFVALIGSCIVIGVLRMINSAPRAY